LLDNRLLIASLNRGGLVGSSWELDDPMTGATPASCHAWRLDGAKILLRVDETEPASLKTMLASAQAINECNALALPMFLEPLPVTKTDKGYVVVKTAVALARLAGVASALGDSSRYLWLKLPIAMVTKRSPARRRCRFFCWVANRPATPRCSCANWNPPYPRDPTSAAH